MVEDLRKNFGLLSFGIHVIRGWIGKGLGIARMLGYKGWGP